nr:sugar phosphate isomerase/epimerase [Ardenticatena sp.]
MMHTAALSTMWMQLRFDTVLPFAQAAATLGFGALELSHIITPEMLADLSPAALALPVRVCHHPCPNPGGVPELSATDPEAHARAVAAARCTLQTAANLGACAVVLHAGLVPLDRRWENALRARFLAGERETSAYAELWARVQQERARLADAALGAVRRALDVLVPLAEQLGIRLGLETGEWVAAIPSFEEAHALLADYPASALGLWVDTGHATIVERLGGPPLREWLCTFAPRLVGLHYHDVHGLRDHLIPGRGTIAWHEIAPLIPTDALPTCEFDWYYTPDEIAEGRALLAAYGLVQ